jgi:hypothetical protein
MAIRLAESSTYCDSRCQNSQVISANIARHSLREIRRLASGPALRPPIGQALAIDALQGSNGPLGIEHAEARAVHLMARHTEGQPQSRLALAQPPVRLPTCRAVGSGGKRAGRAA